jgi:hypothetical protein
MIHAELCTGKGLHKKIKVFSGDLPFVSVYACIYGYAFNVDELLLERILCLNAFLSLERHIVTQLHSKSL